MARSQVILPPDSTGQAMGVVTYVNDAGATVAASETVMVDSTTGLLIKPATETTLDTIAQLLRTQNALLQGVQFLLALMTNTNLNDTTVFLDKEI